jgi:hypothetical protein
MHAENKSHREQILMHKLLNCTIEETPILRARLDWLNF